LQITVVAEKKDERENVTLAEERMLKII